MKVAGEIVVVTGAGGFIGVPLVRLLTGRGRPVRVLMGPPGADVHSAPDEVDTVFAEIDDPRAMDELVDGAGVVIHLAGLPSVADSFRRPAEHARVHATGTATVLQACRNAGVARVVYVSSAEVYGRPQADAVNETHRLQARSPYAAAKIAAEKFVEAHVMAGQGTAVVLRPFSVYGPRPLPEGLLGTIIAQAGNGGPVRLADLQPVRDYCHVDDLCDAIDRATAVSMSEPFRVFNIGTGRGTSVRELAELTLEALGLELEVIEREDRDRPAQADIRHLVADPGRAARELGWRAGTGLRQGLRGLVDRVNETDHEQTVSGGAE